MELKLRFEGFLADMEGTDLSLIEMMKFVNDLNRLINLSYIIGHNYDALPGNVKGAKVQMAINKTVN